MDLCMLSNHHRNGFLDILLLIVIYLRLSSRLIASKNLFKISAFLYIRKSFQFIQLNFCILVSLYKVDLVKSHARPFCFTDKIK